MNATNIENIERNIEKNDNNKITINKISHLAIKKELIHIIDYILDKIETLSSIGITCCIWLTYFSYKHFHLTNMDLFITFIILILPVFPLIQLEDNIKELKKFLESNTVNTIYASGLNHLNNIISIKTENIKNRNMLFILKDIYYVLHHSYGYHVKSHIKIHKYFLSTVWITILIGSSVVTLLFHFL